MEEENDAFYAVRKGKVIGIYKSLNDRQDQAGVWPFPSQGKSSEKVSPPAGLRQGSKSLQGAFLFSQQKVAPTALPDTSPESSVVAPKTKFVQGLWNVNNPNLAVLCKEARDLKDKFSVFSISHIPRAQNSVADAQANLAVYLQDGQVEVD